MLSQIAPQKKDILIDQRVREITGHNRDDDSAVLVMPVPAEGLVQRELLRPAPDGQQNKLEVLFEYARKHGQLIATAAIQNNIHYPSEPLYRENYRHFESQQVVRVASNPVSTFSIDVDTGAYTNMRRWLNQGRLPPEDAVRVEEFINYFDYDYPLPANKSTPFHVSTEIAPTPWNPNTHLLRIGIQAYKVPKAQLPASNLVFLIDVSGSMSSADKLPLLQQALTLLVHQLDARDRISMVVYAGASGLVLPPTPGDHKADILMLKHAGNDRWKAELKLFIESYPDYPLPDELEN